MARVSEVFGDLDGYNDRPKGEFELMPHGTYVLAKITEVKGKQGACMVKSETQTIQAGLDGNYGHPHFWDHVNFITPAPVDPELDEEAQKKGRQKIGMWARRITTLGLDPKQVDTEWTADEYADFFQPTVGATVIIKTRLEAARGEYKARNTANDYVPDTPANRKKYGLDAEVEL